MLAGALLVGAAFMFAAAAGVLWEVLPDFGFARRLVAFAAATVAVSDAAWAIRCLRRS